MSSIKIIQKSITDISADAIVNAANSGLWAGGGVCGAIFNKAGINELTEACDAIGHCDTGCAVITPGFNCLSKFIIHAVGPRYVDGNYNEPELLYGAYENSLKLCKENDIHSVVFPLISAGIFGYPLEKAWTQAVSACKDFIEQNQNYSLDIIFAIPDHQNAVIGNKILGN